jgi:2-polyprenyl-3-methyl-5-hydroxy-6-metoxy-1,4-benzoquinol methylase
MTQPTYEQQLAQEAAVWGKEATQQAQTTPPDWRFHRQLRHNIIMHGADIDALLARIQPAMRTLELGCSSGWLTLAMAQHGAHAHGIDISPQSTQIAQDYYARIQQDVRGSARYEVADLNALQLPAATYDVIAIKGTLHHLLRMDHVIGQIHHALKPNGLLWVSDSAGDEHLSSVLLSAALTLLLPTEMPYREKIKGILRFGLNAPSRVKASMEAEGLSPFEGAGREHDWIQLIQQQFKVEQRIDAPAITGYITAQLRAPENIAVPFLRALYRVDKALVRIGLLKNTGVILYARKQASS